MKIFKITPKIEAVCSSERTRYGFRHLATLFVNGSEKIVEKCCYYNRTWERWEFQTVLVKLISKAQERGIISKEEGEQCIKFCDADHTDWSSFKIVSQTALLGDILTDDVKEQNDWKKRMIKAGFPELDIPSDWDALSEEDKKSRLDAVIKLMQDVPKK